MAKSRKFNRPEEGRFTEQELADARVSGQRHAANRAKEDAIAAEAIREALVASPKPSKKRPQTRDELLAAARKTAELDRTVRAAEIAEIDAGRTVYKVTGDVDDLQPLEEEDEV